MESQRQSVITALAQNNCGPQYRAAAAAPQRGIFETIFGGGDSGNYGGVDVSQGGSFRTLCVRTLRRLLLSDLVCDHRHRISPTTNRPAATPARTPKSRSTPTAPMTTSVRAATIQGQRYVDLPNAFRYRQQFDPSCSCRKPGQSWADAMGQSPRPRSDAATSS